MLETVYQCQKTIFAVRVGPLGAHLDDFVPVLESRGYSLRNIRHRYGALTALSWWLIREKIALRDLSQDHIRRFIHLRKEELEVFHGSNNPSTLAQFFAFLRDRRAIPEDLKVVEETEIQRHIREYSEYLVKDRGLASSSIQSYRDCTRRFLNKACPDGRLELQALSPELIAAFLTEFARVYSKHRAGLMVTSLRSYFRYLKFRGLIQTDLDRCVLATSRRGGGVPRSHLSASEVARLLKHCDRSCAVGKRDYTILLLLVRYGLRSCEVVRLSLTDIDWERAEIRISGKGRKKSRLPLIEEAGTALVEYLQSGRPRCKLAAVFVSSRAPYRALEPGAVGALVSVALKRANLNPRNRGAHMLRHTVATQALRQGATLDEVRELLRHRNINTTAIYAKVDFDRLAPLAQAWPIAPTQIGGGQ